MSQNQIPKISCQEQKLEQQTFQWEDACQTQDSHALNVNQLTEVVTSIRCEKVSEFSDLIGQLWVQIKLCWELRYPIPERRKNES